jgi:hypothetical protein
VESIARRSLDGEDRMRVQEAAAASAQSNPESHLAEYAAHPDSFAGRYVSADLMKETFAAYRETPEARNRYNAAVHNAAAVLASEQLRRLLSIGPDAGAELVVLLTGIPGAGKTSAVITEQAFPEGHRAIYEGQLAKPETAFQKLDQVLQSGHQPVIVAVHAAPEDALRNTLRRFDIEGRGASIAVMADIQGRLPDAMEAVLQRYGTSVDIAINDNRDRRNPRTLAGWEHIAVLRSEGGRDAIEQRLRAELERQRGAISIAAWRQAHGASPLGPYLGLARQGASQRSAHDAGSGLQGSDRAAAFVHQRSAEALKAFPELAGSFQAVAAVAVEAVKRGLSLRAQQDLTAAAQERLHGYLAQGHVIGQSPSVAPTQPRRGRGR